ncbi:4'-phosphopantetheinyl transferase family protein [Psychroserpens mesophilus]|uniref:4'-phosphopantetheinyl transferase family protein n=1 Tax=Psychroserpens mesophilus TaxID=325473 RepID=UPI00059086C3|nr:4'-phosphopantetheinyl transferase superfamily protein [Psychroserpens mesophilus]
MIGNDIVDLQQAAKDSNWKRFRFLDKVFTQKEQCIIHSSENQNQMVWLLWTMKEAAYKAHIRETKLPFLNPKRMQCQLGLNNEGVVCIDEKRYHSKSIITSKYIHSIAMKTGFKCPEIHFFKLPETDQSQMLRGKIVNQISLNKGKELSAIEIKKSAIGVPNVFYNGQQIMEALSISHHGEFGAFAMC